MNYRFDQNQNIESRNFTLNPEKLKWDTLNHVLIQDNVEIDQAKLNIWLQKLNHFWISLKR